MPLCVHLSQPQQKQAADEILRMWQTLAAYQHSTTEHWSMSRLTNLASFCFSLIKPCGDHPNRSNCESEQGWPAYLHNLDLLEPILSKKLFADHLP